MTDDKFSTGMRRGLGMDEVPFEKFGTMLKRTIIGGVFIGGSVLGLWKLEWPWWVGVPLGVLGATVWSTQMVTHAFTALLNPAKAIRAIIKGEK